MTIKNFWVKNLETVDLFLQGLQEKNVSSLGCFLNVMDFLRCSRCHSEWSTGTAMVLGIADAQSIAHAEYNDKL